MRTTRWASSGVGPGVDKGKDLDKLAQISSLKKQYFPVYLFKRDVNGMERFSWNRGLDHVAWIA